MRRLILELAVVHDLADRWSGVRRNFDKVEIGIRGDAKGIFDTHDAYLFPSWTDQTDFRYADALVDAGLSADGASLIDLSSIATATCSVRSQRLGYHTISKKALHKQGPVPTDHGKSRLPNAEPAQLVCQ